MPKIIENLSRKLMDEARRQIRENGYAAMTIRSVAKSCGVSVGTVYNYFVSKDALTAAFMLEDWKNCVLRIENCSSASEVPEPVLRSIYDELQGFCRLHGAIFHDEAAAPGFSGSFSRYHSLLRSQLAAPIRKFCRDDFTAEFIAESMLVWTVAGREFCQIHDLVKKLL